MFIDFDIDFSSIVHRLWNGFGRVLGNLDFDKHDRLDSKSLVIGQRDHQGSSREEHDQKSLMAYDQQSVFAMLFNAL